MTLASSPSGALKNPFRDARLSRRDLLGGLGAGGAALLLSGKSSAQSAAASPRRLDLHHHFAPPRWKKRIVETNRQGAAQLKDYSVEKDLQSMEDPRNPKIVGLFPRPAAPPDAPYSDFCFSRGRFGSHNTQCWIAPGKARPDIMVITWFNAGVRVFDISNPTEPKEIASFVPPHEGEIENYESWWRGSTENVFVEWDRNLIWIGTHEGSYCLSCPALGKPVLEPRKVDRWSVPHCNVGWDDATPKAFYFGRPLSRNA